MATEYITIPKGGRPPKQYSSNFLETLNFQRHTMTVREIAELHGVSLSTANRWLRKARSYEQE